MQIGLKRSWFRVSTKKRVQAGIKKLTPQRPKVYLIDTENMGEAWLPLVKKLNFYDKILVFYTKNSKSLSCDDIAHFVNQRRVRSEWISCVVGVNALDFQLVTELGSRIALDKHSQYIIVSKDKGFDAVVDYWTKRNRHIERVGEQLKPTPKPSPVQKTPTSKPTPQKQTSEKPTPTPTPAPVSDPQKQTSEKPIPTPTPAPVSDPQKQTSVKPTPTPNPAPKATTKGNNASSPLSDKQLAFVKEVAKSVKAGDKALLFLALSHLLNPNEGKRIYKVIIKDDKLTAQLNALLIQDKQARVKHYLTLMYRNNKGKVDELYTLYRASSAKKLAALHETMKRKYGEKQGTELYRIIKAHYNILKQIEAQSVEYKVKLEFSPFPPFSPRFGGSALPKKAPLGELSRSD